MRAHNAKTQATVTPEIALQYLKEGNSRFVNNLKANRDLLAQANETREGQWPFAAILSCIDSRTSAELIFDQGLGDIVSIRIAGNIINTDILGSLEFACHVLGSKLIVVLGHTHCGAIKGACNHLEMGNLSELLSKVQPAVYEQSKNRSAKECTAANLDFVESVSDTNVKRSVRSIINRSFILEQMIEAGQIAVIGGKHNLETGQVRFFDDTWVSNRKEVLEDAKEPSAP